MNRVLFLQISTLRILKGNHWACSSNVMWLTWYVATNESFTYLSILTIPKNPEYYDFSKIQFVAGMKPMQWNDETDEKEKLLAARMGRKRPFWCCQHMLALAHAGVGRNTRVRANSPTTSWSVSTIILALLIKFPTVGWGTLDYQKNTNNGEKSCGNIFLGVS